MLFHSVRARKVEDTVQDNRGNKKNKEARTPWLKGDKPTHNPNQ